MDLQRTGKEGISMEDLYERCGVKSVRVCLETRCLQHLGHLGRYPESRIERKILSARIEGLPVELTVQSGRRSIVRHQYARQITEFLVYDHTQSGLEAPPREAAMEMWPRYVEMRVEKDGNGRASSRADAKPKAKHGTWWKRWLKKYSSYLEVKA